MKVGKGEIDLIAQGDEVSCLRRGLWMRKLQRMALKIQYEKTGRTDRVI
jgi:hypothetical protein